MKRRARPPRIPAPQPPNGLLAQRALAAGWRRPEHRPSGPGMGAAATATFLGLLAVGSLSSAKAGEAAVSADSTPSAEPYDRLAPDALDGDRGHVAPGLPTPGPAGATSGAVGSVLESGKFIDAAALTSLSGEARFDTGLAGGAQASVPPPQSLAQATAVPASAAPVTLALGAPPELPSLAAGENVDSSGENLGPIGEHQTGSDGDDVLTGTDADDVLLGGAGNDTISGGAGDDRLAGGTGDDQVRGDAGNDQLDGGSGNDRLDGGSGNDTADGGSGDDSVLGGVGDDRLAGGDGNDTLDGNAGADELTGGYGNDTMTIDQPDDLAFENRWGPDAGGDDTLVVGSDFGASLKAAFPTLARDGVATFAVGDSVMGPLPSGFNGFRQQVGPNVENVRLTGSEAHDLLGDANANTLEGNDGGNLIFGGAADDRLRGGDGHDRLMGGDGGDLLFGDAGDDWLDGGDGTDTLWGGAGDDTYFMGLSDSAVTTIFDYEGHNRVVIENGLADATKARMVGNDLHLSVDGHDRAIVQNYAARPEAFSEVQLAEGRTVTFQDLLAMGRDAVPVPAQGDMLQHFVDPSLSTAPVPLAGAAPGVAETNDPFAAQVDAGVPELFAGTELWVGDDASAQTVAAVIDAQTAIPTGFATRADELHHHGR